MYRFLLLSLHVYEFKQNKVLSASLDCVRNGVKIISVLGIYVYLKLINYFAKGLMIHSSDDALPESENN